MALIVTLAMVFGMLPANLNTAKADITEEEDRIVISGEVTLDERLYIGGEKTLVLEEGCVLNATKGIEVSGNNKLTIEGTGKLIATGTEGESGIGASYDKEAETGRDVGEIVINGGDITAQGGTYEYNGSLFGGAGIGGYGKAVRRAEHGIITINGGKVKAIGGATTKDSENPKGAAGIGGGNGQSIGQINITGGEVEASAGTFAAAIGSGNDPLMDKAKLESINISGGTIVADGNIGCATFHYNMIEAFDIKITGGNIDAKYIGGGSEGGYAALTLDWNEANKDTTRINAQFARIIGVINFAKPFMLENDATRTAVTTEDLVKDKEKKVIVPLTPTPVEPTTQAPSDDMAKYNAAVKVAKSRTVKLKSVKAKKHKKVTAVWYRAKGGSGYQLMYTLGNNTTKKTINTIKTTKKVISKLKAKKTYKFKIRTFDSIMNPTTKKKVTVYGKWSKVKKVKVKK